MKGVDWGALVAAIVALLGVVTAWLKADLAQKQVAAHIARHARSNADSSPAAPPGP